MDPRMIQNWNAEVEHLRSLIDSWKTATEAARSMNAILSTKMELLREEIRSRNWSQGLWGGIAASQCQEASRVRVVNEGLRAEIEALRGENEALRNRLRSCCSALRDAGEGHPVVEDLVACICGEES